MQFSVCSIRYYFRIKIMDRILAVSAIFFTFINGLSATIPIPDHRIVGGKNASILDYPYQVSVKKSNSHICGGSIFHTLYILTAAHCVENGVASQYSIRAGSSFVSTGGKKVKVCQIIAKEDYNFDTLDNDIAILKLCSPLVFSDKILPVALPEAGEGLAVGSRALVSGWGYEAENGFIPSDLKQVELPIVSPSDCQNAYAKFGDISNNMICAGFIQTGGKDACQGDSGGPLRANGKLMGVVSWGFGCARPHYPGVYTKVANYRNWIKSVTNY
ncbi:trypsin beta [Anoplophora glabripennis]|nr:trypsin beta [Anoplophora glabripennis]